jgi:outer membrane protein TolC
MKKRNKRTLAVCAVLFLVAGMVSAGETPEVVTMSLDDCVEYSLANSFEVRLARLDLYIAETELLYSQAVWDTYLYGSAMYNEDKRQQLSVFAPDDNQTNMYLIGARKKLPTGTTVSAEWSDTRTWSNSGFVTKRPAHNAELRMQVEQPLMKNAFGMVDRGEYSITKLAVKNADLEMKDRMEQRIADTAIAYIEVLSAEELLRNTEAILDMAEDLYAQEEKNYELGLRELGDLYATEANVANRKAEVLAARNRYDGAVDQLKLVMNAGRDVEIKPSDVLKTVRLRKELPEYLEQAFEYRRDHRIRMRQVKMRDLDLRIKKNQLWPEVDLTLSMAMNGLEKDFERAAGKSFVNDNTEYIAGIEFELPIENSLSRGRYDRAKQEDEKALVLLKQNERRIITEVTVAYNDVVSFGESMRYTAKAVELNRRKLEEERKRFKYGRSTTKRMIDYQSDLLRAQIQDIRYTADHRKAKVRLFRAVNMILDNYREVL